MELFASLREAVGRKELSIEVGDGQTLGALRSQLKREWPALGHIPFVFAVNQEYAKDQETLADGDEIALVPAISGG